MSMQLLLTNPDSSQSEEKQKTKTHTHEIYAIYWHFLTS